MQVLNQSISSSSDCFVDVRLTARQAQEPADETPTGSGDGRGRYEINAAWQSDELTAFEAAMTIPAAVAEPGRTYRVRCRHQRKCPHRMSP